MVAVHDVHGILGNARADESESSASPRALLYLAVRRTYAQRRLLLLCVQAGFICQRSPLSRTKSDPWAGQALMSVAPMSDDTELDLRDGELGRLSAVDDGSMPEVVSVTAAGSRARVRTRHCLCVPESPG